MWYYAFYAGLIAVSGALAFQLVRVAATMTARRAVAATTAGTVTLATPGEAPAWAGRLATFFTWTGVVSLTLMLVFRVLATGWPPFANMWEFLVAFGWVTLVSYALFERRCRHPVVGATTLMLVVASWSCPSCCSTRGSRRWCRRCRTTACWRYT